MKPGLKNAIVGVVAENPGINADALALLFPDYERRQVIAAAQNACSESRIVRLTGGGKGRLAWNQPATYQVATAEEREAALDRVPASRAPRAPKRRPVASVWELGARAAEKAGTAA